jgi:hypothetical protein
MKRHILVGLALAAATVLVSSGARAEVAAAYVQGYGGLASGDGAASSMSTSSPAGLGFQLGARVLLFEGYFDHTSFGDPSVSRGIVGLRGGFGGSGLRLVLRGGVGVIDEHGGALTGRLPGSPDRQGAVARAGLALESHIAPPLLAGFSLDGETFAFPSDFPGGPSRTGSDVFASLRLTFELGI